jgi:hypothetical protein
VHEEIRHFKSLGRGARIMAAIVDGEPHAAGKTLGGRQLTEADECFPAALTHQLGADGHVSDVREPTEPIAADFRSGKDEHEAAKLKLIAGILDVGLDDLIQRERVAQRWRMRAVAALAIMFAGLAAAAGGFAVLAETNAREARLQASRVTERLAAERLRAGDLGQAVDLLSAVAGRGMRGVIDADRVRLIAAGLLPLDEATASVPAWTPFRWNGRAYLRGEGAGDLHDLGEFAPTTWVAGTRFVALMNADGGALVFNKGDARIQQENVARDFMICDAEVRADGAMDIFGITQSGVTLGGMTFSRWRVAADGALTFEEGGRDLPFGRQDLCGDGEASPVIRPVSALTFPSRIEERLLWTESSLDMVSHTWIEQTFSQSTGLGSDTLNQLFNQAIGYGSDWYAAHQLVRGETTFVMGPEAYGMAGERWALCATRTDHGACTLFSFAHIASRFGGVRVSRRGDAVAAFGHAFDLLPYTPELLQLMSQWERTAYANDAPDEITLSPEEAQATNGNVFLASGGDFARWSRPDGLNALGRVVDLAFSPNGLRLALVTTDSLYIADTDGSSISRAPFGIESGELRGVAWRDDGVVLVAMSDLSLAAVGADGQIAWDRLDLGGAFAPCDAAEAHAEDYENLIWLAPSIEAPLALVGRGSCGIVVDTALGAPVSGLVRLDQSQEPRRAPLLFDRPVLSQRGDTIRLDFYSKTLTRRGMAGAQPFSRLTGRIDGALATSLLDLR